MQELNYPFDPSYIIKKRKSIKRELLADGSARIKKENRRFWWFYNKRNYKYS